MNRSILAAVITILWYVSAVMWIVRDEPLQINDRVLIAFFLFFFTGLAAVIAYKKNEQ